MVESLRAWAMLVCSLKLLLVLLSLFFTLSHAVTDVWHHVGVYTSQIGQTLLLNTMLVVSTMYWNELSMYLVI